MYNSFGLHHLSFCILPVAERNRLCLTGQQRRLTEYGIHQHAEAVGTVGAVQRKARTDGPGTGELAVPVAGELFQLLRCVNDAVRSAIGILILFFRTLYTSHTESNNKGTRSNDFWIISPIEPP